MVPWPCTDAWYTLEKALLNFLIVPNCTFLSYFPGFKDTCKMTMATPIPKESYNGKGPIEVKSLLLNPKDTAISRPLLHSTRVWLTDRASKFAHWIHFKILRSCTKFCWGSQSIKFLKWQVLYWKGIERLSPFLASRYHWDVLFFLVNQSILICWLSDWKSELSITWTTPNLQTWFPMTWLERVICTKQSSPI